MTRKFLFLSIFFLFTASAAFALEQSFTQNGLKAVVRLSPDRLTAGKKVNLAIRLEKEGQIITDRRVTLEIYEKDALEAMIRREVDLLEDEYVDSWSFEKPGDYRVGTTIADPMKPDETLHYEIKASVGEAKDAEHKGHDEHGFFSHHFGGGKWGWWGAGMMLLIMVPMMLIL